MSPESKTTYEKKDASARIVFIAAGILILVLVFVGVCAQFVLKLFSNPALMASNISQTIPLPPEPRLEANPLESLQALRVHEEDILNHYGWIDKTKGIVRIPIDQAMALTVERGLPTRGKQQ